mgnify:FL=1
MCGRFVLVVDGVRNRRMGAKFLDKSKKREIYLVT